MQVVAVQKPGCGHDFMPSHLDPEKKGAAEPKINLHQEYLVAAHVTIPPHVNLDTKSLDCKRLPQQHISFGTVQVRFYVSGLGDNPAVSCGVPVGLTDVWCQGPTRALSGLQDQDTGKPFAHCERLPQKERLDRCLRNGNTLEEISSTMEEIRCVQEARIDNLPLLPNMEAFPSLEDIPAPIDLLRSTFSAVSKQSSRFLRRMASTAEATEEESTAASQTPPSTITDSIMTWLAPLAQGLAQPVGDHRADRRLHAFDFNSSLTTLAL